MADKIPGEPKPARIENGFAKLGTHEVKVLVFGVTGMLGSAMFRVLSEDPNLSVFGTARDEGAPKAFPSEFSIRLRTGVDAESHDSLVNAFGAIRPNVVINCIGLVKQLPDANEHLKAIATNSLLPHRLAKLCQVAGARLVHISTDCVFSGRKGNYLESDVPDASDLYGRTKLLGEVDYPHAITLRTSIIGHEVSGHRSLVDWFLSQNGIVNGFTKAIFSGLPTVELSRIIRDIVIPNSDIHGLYHLSTTPISKFDLLVAIANVYGKHIEICEDNSLVIDRSLNADRFKKATGYVAPNWQTLIERMYSFRLSQERK